MSVGTRHKLRWLHLDVVEGHAAYPDSEEAPVDTQVAATEPYALRGLIGMSRSYSSRA